MYYFQEEMFIGLLLRAMKSDVNLKRVTAFAKRLLQVCGERLFSFSDCIALDKLGGPVTSCFYLSVMVFVYKFIKSR